MHAGALICVVIVGLW